MRRVLLLCAAAVLAASLDAGVCAGASLEGAGGEPAHQHAPWQAISKRLYGAALREGAIRPGLVVDGSHDPTWPTIVFVHGRSGHPGDFAGLASPFRGWTNLVAFAYDDSEPLAPSAELLRRSLRGWWSPVVIVAHSMGALLPIYVGATDRERSLCGGLGALYLNPLIGGSRYADDIPALRWLRVLQPGIQRLFFAPVVADLAPYSRFQQSAFGPSATPSCFARTTTILFTEAAGREPGIRPDRVPLLFGTTWQALLRRLGTVLRRAPQGPDPHGEPLHPAVSVPLILETLEEACVAAAGTTTSTEVAGRR